MSATDMLLEQGIAAARGGDRTAARTLLTQLVEENERSEQGWLWLAGVTEEPDNIRICLENVLELNPANGHARQGLAWVDQRYGSAPATPAPRAPAAGPIHPIHAPVASPPVASPPVAAAAPAAAPVVAPAALAAAAPVVAVAAAAPVVAAEAKRLAAEKKAEAKRLAAEKQAEAKRLAAEKQAEAKRLAAEKQAEAKRLAAEKQAESKRLAAEKQAEAKRLAAEKQAEAQKARAPYPAYAVVAGRGPDLNEAAAACPYCGEMNELKRTWCSRCEQGLMIRGPVREERSVWVSIIGVLWKAGGVFGIIGSVAALVLALIGYSTLKSLAGKADVPVPFDTFAYALLGGMFAFGQIKVAGAMMDRQRWAYIVVLVVNALQALGALGSALLGGSLIRSVLAEMDVRALPADSSTAALKIVIASLSAVLVAGVVIQGLLLLVTLLGWRDYFGPMVRFLPEVKGASDADLFNNGLACKTRKMWFMAMRQWEAAVGKSSRDAEYLHALSFAYAKLGWLPQAREALERASRIAPNDERLKASRARLDQIPQA